MIHSYLLVVEVTLKYKQRIQVVLHETQDT